MITEYFTSKHKCGIKANKAISIFISLCFHLINQLPVLFFLIALKLGLHDTAKENKTKQNASK